MTSRFSPVYTQLHAVKPFQHVFTVFRSRFRQRPRERPVPRLPRSPKLRLPSLRARVPLRPHPPWSASVYFPSATAPTCRYRQLRNASRIAPNSASGRFINPLRHQPPPQIPQAVGSTTAALFVESLRDKKVFGQMETFGAPNPPTESMAGTTASRLSRVLRARLRESAMARLWRSNNATCREAIESRRDPKGKFEKLVKTSAPRGTLPRGLL